MLGSFEILQNGAGTIGGAVVHRDDFFVKLGFLYAAEQFEHGVFFVVNRYHYGKFGHFILLN